MDPAAGSVLRSHTSAATNSRPNANSIWGALLCRMLNTASNKPALCSWAGQGQFVLLEQEDNLHLLNAVPCTPFCMLCQCLAQHSLAWISQTALGSDPAKRTKQQLSLGPVGEGILCQVGKEDNYQAVSCATPCHLPARSDSQAKATPLSMADSSISRGEQSRGGCCRC